VTAVALKDVTSTSFGLIIAFLLPGVTALFSLSFWFTSAARAFHTFLTTKSNAGLFLFLLLGALIFGLVVSAVRSFLYETLLGRINRVYGPALTPTERQRLGEEPRFVAFRAAIDETYRYYQFQAGMTIVAPALFIGWLNSLHQQGGGRAALIAGFIALELVLVFTAIGNYRGYLRYARAILARPPSAEPKGGRR
jgi:hypothetical protein